MISSPIRHELAQRCAQLVADHGMDYRSAKTRAVQEAFGKERVPAADLPDSVDIDAALLEHLELFDATGHQERVALLQEAAMRGMALLARFTPLVTGAAWKGIASEQAFVHLQLFLESSKELEYELMNQGIRFELSEMRRGAGISGKAVDGRFSEQVPALIIDYHGTPIALALYEMDSQRGALKARDRLGNPVRGTAEQMQVRMSTNKNAN